MNFSTIFANPKTTVLGIAALIGVAAHCYATGALPTASDFATIAAAFGLVVASDGKAS